MRPHVFPLNLFALNRKQETAESNPMKPVCFLNVGKWAWYGLVPVLGLRRLAALFLTLATGSWHGRDGRSSWHQGEGHADFQCSDISDDDAPWPCFAIVH